MYLPTGGACWFSRIPYVPRKQACFESDARRCGSSCDIYEAAPKRESRGHVAVRSYGACPGLGLCSMIPTPSSQLTLLVSTLCLPARLSDQLYFYNVLLGQPIQPGGIRSIRRRGASTVCGRSSLDLVHAQAVAPDTRSGRLLGYSCQSY